MNRAGELDQRFQRVSEALVQPASPRWKLTVLNTFLVESRNAPAAVEAFLLESADTLQGVVLELDVGGLSGAFLEETALLVRRAVERSPVLAGEPLLTRTMTDLLRAAAGRYACVNDLASTWRTLGRTEEPPDWWIDVQRLPDLDVHDRVERLSEQAHRLSHPVKAELDHVVRVARSARSDGPHAACTAVVETGYASDPRDVGVGGIRLLRVEILAERGTTDDLRADVVPSDARQDAMKAFDAPVAAARRLLERIQPAARGRYLTGRIHFEAPTIPHSGQSAHLAVAALFFSAAQQYLEARRRFEIRPLIVFTGSVDADGNVLPIAGDSLDLKVEAAFHSWDRVLVVPFDHLVEARAVADRLNAAHPGRNLVVVGAHTLDEVFQDRRVMREVVTPRSAHAARWLWRRRASAGGIAAVLALVAALTLPAWRARDSDPVRVVPTADGMALENARGSVVGRIVSSTRAAYPPDGSNESQFVALGDPDGDGNNEVCWSEGAQGEAGGYTHVLCREPNAQTPIFDRRLVFPGLFPFDPQIASDRYNVRRLLLVDVDRDGRDELVLGLTHSLLYPAIVLVMDPMSGDERGRYVHTGAVIDLIAHDLDEDGFPELIGAGINNSMDRAVLFVLDARNVEGTSPTDPDRMPASPLPGREVAYVRFEKGPLSRLSRVEPRTGAVALSVDASDRLILVSVEEGVYRSRGDGPSHHARLIYYFTYDLRPRGVASSSEYDRIEAELIEDGWLESRFSAAERRELLDAIEFWDGARWHDSPLTRFRPPSTPGTSGTGR